MIATLAFNELMKRISADKIKIHDKKRQPEEPSVDLVMRKV